MKKRPDKAKPVGHSHSLSRLVRGPRALVLLAATLLLGFAVWVIPKPRERFVPVSSPAGFDTFGGLQHRQIAWRPAVELSAVVPLEAAEASLIAPRLADGGTTLYFTLRPPSGQADIYRSRRIHGEWQPGEPVTELNSSADDIGAVCSLDDRHLLLYSNRPGGAGGFDIYLSHWKDGRWTRPVNVGKPVNSTADEYDPALSPDGLSLYFASNRDRPSPGFAEVQEASASDWNGTLRHRESSNFDLYVGVSKGDLSWQSVLALDKINRPDSSEGAPFVSSDGSFLYFASDRPVRGGEARNLDLFRSNITGSHRRRRKTSDRESTRPITKPNRLSRRKVLPWCSLLFAGGMSGCC